MARPKKCHESTPECGFDCPIRAEFARQRTWTLDSAMKSHATYSSYLTECINKKVKRKSTPPQNRQLIVDFY